MARINIVGIDDNTGAPKVIGWFNPAKCESWSPGTHWNGSDNVLNTSGPDTMSDTLYRTPGGRWIRETSSRWVGTTDQYRYLTDDEARDWLMRADHAETEAALEQYFGALPDESPVGRPNVLGDTKDVKLAIPVDLLARIDQAAGAAGVSRAEWLRTAAETVLASL